MNCAGRRLASLVFTAVVCASAASATTFVVNSTGDEPDADTTDGLCRTALGSCTLRAAIEQANSSPGADTIAFNIPGPGVHTISPASPLPALTDDAGVTIDGYTQPGASPNTLAIGDDAVLVIEIDGTNAGLNANGLKVQGRFATLMGLVIGGFDGLGIWIAGGYGHQVTGCFIGTDTGGAGARGNQGGLHIDTSGIDAAPLPSSPTLVNVGGPAPSQRNLISGNRSNGISGFATTNVEIQNNYVGTSRSGMAAIPNLGNGIALDSVGSIIGGSDVFVGAGGTANVVSGNAGGGIVIVYGAANYIAGNYIGTDPTGRVAVPNGSGIELLADTASDVVGNVISGNSYFGVKTNGSSRLAIHRNHVGADIGGLPLGNRRGGIFLTGETVLSNIGGGGGNRIAFNGGFGVAIGEGPVDLAVGNALSRNFVHDNAGLGIDLGNDGVTPNNDCDSGRGPNLGQNYPVLASASSTPSITTIRGSLNSVPNTFFWIEFFANSRCDPSGYGQGETFLGSVYLETDATCNLFFETTLPVAAPAGSVITATATDPAGNTSEFSACLPVTVGLDFYSVTPCRIADTRGPAGPYGAPPLSAAADRTFAIAGQCGIPVDAKAVAFNFTVTQTGGGGDVQIFPVGTPLPASHALPFSKGQTRAKNAVLALGAGGAIGTHLEQASGTTDLVIDVSGYFR